MASGAQPKIWDGTAVEDGAVTFFARLERDTPAGEVVYVAPADLASIAYTVTEVTQGGVQTPRGGGPLVIADVVYDALQLTDLWTSRTNDVLGYNFRCRLDQGHFPDGAVVAYVEFVFHLTDGTQFPLGFKVRLARLIGS